MEQIHRRATLHRSFNHKLATRIDNMKTNVTLNEASLGGQFTFPSTSLTVQRMGYGAMQLAGPGVWGPPKDPESAVAVLREAVAAGVNRKTFKFGIC
jgi:hypothetical protein